VLRPPFSGGSTIYTARLANHLVPFADIVVGLTEHGVQGVGPFLNPEIERVCIPGTQRNEAVVAESDWLAKSKPDWCLYCYPGTLDNHRLPDGIRTTVIIHDLQHLAFPENFSLMERWNRDRAIRSAVDEADLILTISNFTAGELARLYPESIVKTAVIYSGGESASSHEDLPQPDAPFLLYPANFWPHKNHDVLLDAFGILRARDPELKLVFTGGITSFADPALQGKLRQEGVVCRGYVTKEELACLMGSAECLVFPSTYEGFGMPVLEALQRGTPVACSNTSSLPEVGGDAAQYFDPESPEDIAAAVERAIANRDIPEWQKKARDQASKFTFERTARLLMEAMRDVDTVTKSICHQERYQVSGESDLENFWKSYPGVDAILLGAGRSISQALVPDLLRVVTPLDAARLEPRQLGMLVSRGVKVSSSSNQLTVNEYKHLLKLVSENNLVVYASSDGEGSVARRYSPLEAFRFMLLQLKYLKRTCRECVMAVLAGRWG
jgi:glycosyltransferase involved in cell wall biosynthesis